jgi:hypothetical protein
MRIRLLEALPATPVEIAQIPSGKKGIMGKEGKP